MATHKVTFTLDAETVGRIDNASKTLAKPKSQIVREAVADYHQRMGRVSESERLRRLQLFDTLFPLIPMRSQQEVDDELAEIRYARQSGGRLTRTEDSE